MKKALFGLWCLCILAGGVLAAPEWSSEYSALRARPQLQSEPSQTNPSTVQVLIDVSLQKGWHIYGQSVGDVGLPTTLTIQTSKHVQFKRFHWPKERTFTFAGKKSKGYSGSVTVMAELEATSLPLKNESITIKGSWLACNDACIPEEALITKTLNGYPSDLILPPQHARGSVSIEALLAIILAFIGGILLNAMPCVFPVLSLKIMSLLKLGDTSAREGRLHGMAYTAGIVTSFIVMALLLNGLRLAGHEIGWGFQMQSPTFIKVLIVIMVLATLYLLDLIKLPASAYRFLSLFSGAADRANAKKDTLGHFMTGVLATILATPCTVPFMAPAVGYALTQSGWQSLAVFISLGLGLASPFLLISSRPSLASKLPKPGKWMVTIKHILAIPMIITVIWLVWVHIALVTPQPSTFSVEQIEQYLAEGRPVMVEATATWCLTCQVNKTSLSSDAVQEAFKAKNVAYIRADWTQKNPVITAYLESFNRSGVPLLVYYPVNQDPILLPQLATPKAILDVLD